MFIPLIDSCAAIGCSLQVLGAVNAYSALLAERAGAKALYVSGAGVANASYGIPDLGVTTLEDVCIDVSRMRRATDLPILVDADTGWDDPTRAVRALEGAGANACHLEDQVSAKRCGHRPNKSLVSQAEMVERIKSAVQGRSSNAFSIMARTDAVAGEGMEAAIERSKAYVAAGADMIFAEALYSLENYTAFTEALDVPVLANITEFGKTPLYTTGELYQAGVAMVLYPLSAFRAMSRAAELVYREIISEGSQKGVVDVMQTREELYDVLGYWEAEQQVDKDKDV